MAKNSTSFQIGNPGKPKGSQNKVNKDLRDKIKQLLDGFTVESMSEDLQSLKPAERLNFFMGLAEYVTLKLNRTNITQETAPVTVEDARATLLVKLTKRRELPPVNNG